MKIGCDGFALAIAMLLSPETSLPSPPSDRLNPLIGLDHEFPYYIEDCVYRNTLSITSGGVRRVSIAVRIVGVSIGRRTSQIPSGMTH